MTRKLDLLPSPTPPDVDSAAEAAVPLVLKLLELERLGHQPLRLVKEEPVDAAPVRPVPSLV